MPVSALKSADFWAGALFVAAGAVGLLIARNYPGETAAQMGPGYFPRAISGVLILIGLTVALSAIRNPRTAGHLGVWPWRAIVTVLGSLLLFGWLAPDLGLLLSGAVLVLMSGFATREARPLELIIFTALLVGSVSLVFVYGLGLDLPMLPKDWPWI
jgi:hypothetical protein